MKLNPHTSPSVINLPLRGLLAGALSLLAALLTQFAAPSASAAPVTLTYNTPGTNYWICPVGVTSIQGVGFILRFMGVMQKMFAFVV